MKRFLWCEDSKSGYQFWRAIFRALWPDIIVESKDSNTGLRKAAEKVAPDGNQYYILMDMAVDNPDVLREVNRLRKAVEGKDNIEIIHMHSFEASLLSFELLEQWVFAEKDALREKRQKQLDARIWINKAMYASDFTVSELKLFKESFDGYEYKNWEQITATLLYEITRNTGFETNKSKIGECFINNCCEWKNRENDDICGLDDHRISAAEKARIIVERSVLNEAFKGMW